MELHLPMAQTTWRARRTREPHAATFYRCFTALLQWLTVLRTVTVVYGNSDFLVYFLSYRLCLTSLKGFDSLDQITFAKALTVVFLSYSEPLQKIRSSLRLLCNWSNYHLSHLAIHVVASIRVYGCSTCVLPLRWHAFQYDAAFLHELTTGAYQSNCSFLASWIRFTTVRRVLIGRSCVNHAAKALLRRTRPPAFILHSHRWINANILCMQVTSGYALWIRPVKRALCCGIISAGLFVSYLYKRWQCCVCLHIGTDGIFPLHITWTAAQ